MKFYFLKRQPRFLLSEESYQELKEDTENEILMLKLIGRLSVTCNNHCGYCGWSSIPV